MINELHQRYIFGRRVRVLADHLAALLPEKASILDVGCGDGTVGALIGERRPDVKLCGIDVLLRPETAIPVTRFDGETIPFEDNSHDIVMFVDVLHHTDDPEALLREACRVARRAIVLKDHAQDGPLAGPTLRLMDWVGNARHGVALPYNYWKGEQWRAALDRLGVTIETWSDRLGLYPWPASMLFDRSLHFVARLAVG